MVQPPLTFQAEGRLLEEPLLTEPLVLGERDLRLAELPLVELPLAEPPRVELSSRALSLLRRAGPATKRQCRPRRRFWRSLPHRRHHPYCSWLPHQLPLFSSYGAHRPWR